MDDTYPNTVNIPNSESDLPAQFLLIEFHFDNLEGESFVEQPIDFCTARQFVCVDLCGARTFNCAFKVCLQLLDHSVINIRNFSFLDS